MNRKRIAFLACSLLAALGLGGGAIFWSLLQVPDFYEQVLVEQPDPVQRQRSAKQFVERTVQLIDHIQHSDVWSEEFTQQQVNAWLAEELHRKYPELVPQGLRDPRVKLDHEAIQVGFRFEQDDWSGVVSLRLRTWVPEPNRLAIEIQSIRAGLFPVPLDTVLEEISQQIEMEGWRTEWKQSDGHDVLLVRFDSGQEDQPILEAVAVTEGALRISGRRSHRDPAPGSDTLKIGKQPSLPSGDGSIAPAGD